MQIRLLGVMVFTSQSKCELSRLDEYLGKASAITAAVYLRLAGRPPVPPSNKLSYAENFLYMLDSLFKLWIELLLLLQMQRLAIKPPGIEEAINSEIDFIDCCFVTGPWDSHRSFYSAICDPSNGWLLGTLVRVPR